MSGRRALMIANAAKLPYKREVSYLASSGTQWIDTGVTPTSDMNIEVGIAGSVLGTSVNCFIYGARTGANDATNFALVNFTATAKLRFDRGNINVSPSGNVLPDNYTVVRRIGADNYIDGQLVGTCTATFTPPVQTIYLFAINQNGAVFHGTNDSFALYYCRISTGDSLICDLIPVLDWNNVPCMYDRVSKQLFYNQGSGEFFIAPSDWRDNEVFTIDLNITSDNLTFGVTPYWNAGGWCNIVDWGDGSYQAATNSGTALTHTYAEAGTYKVKVRGNMYRLWVRGTNPAAVIDCNGNWEALGNITTLQGMFNSCASAIFTLNNLPSSLSSSYALIYAFSDCRSAIVNIDAIALNAPYGGWTGLISLDGAFGHCGFANSPGTCTGAIAGFLRKFPNVNNVNNAFHSTNTTTFGDNDYFEIVLTTTEANQSWGFTATSSAGRWYCFDWGDGTAVTANKNLDVFTSGTKVEHTFTTPGTYHIKLATAPCTIVFDPYDSDNGNYAALGQ